MLAIRAEDPGWITDPRPGGSRQLALIVPGVRLPRAQPLDRPLRGVPPDRSRPRPWLDRLRAVDAEPVDDPAVLPPTAAGPARFGAGRVDGSPTLTSDASATAT